MDPTIHSISRQVDSRAERSGEGGKRLSSAIKRFQRLKKSMLRATNSNHLSLSTKEGLEMQNLWAVILTVMLLSFASAAQSGSNSSSSAGAQTSPTAPQAAGNGKASGATAMLKDASFLAELSKSLDAKKLKAGDEVTAKTMDDISSGDQVLIRKGSKLVGHVTEAQPHSKENPESRLGIVFDKAILRDGKEIAFHGEILGYYPPTPVQGVSVMKSGDNPQDRAAGPYIDRSTGQVYTHNPNPTPDIPIGLTPHTSPLPLPGTDDLYLNHSVFKSAAHTVKLVGSAQLRIYVE
jgi:hypothetical protein